METDYYILTKEGKPILDRDNKLFYYPKRSLAEANRKAIHWEDNIKIEKV